jgi:hypothetical protein
MEFAFMPVKDQLVYNLGLVLLACFCFMCLSVNRVAALCCAGIFSYTVSGSYLSMLFCWVCATCLYVRTYSVLGFAYKRWTICLISIFSFVAGVLYLFKQSHTYKINVNFDKNGADVSAGTYAADWGTGRINVPGQRVAYTRPVPARKRRNHSETDGSSDELQYQALQNDDRYDRRNKTKAKNDAIAEAPGWTRTIIGLGSALCLSSAAIIGIRSSTTLLQYWSIASEHILNLPMLIHNTLLWLDGRPEAWAPAVTAAIQPLQTQYPIGGLQTRKSPAYPNFVKATEKKSDDEFVSATDESEFESANEVSNLKTVNSRIKKENSLTGSVPLIETDSKDRDVLSMGSDIFNYLPTETRAKFGATVNYGDYENGISAEAALISQHANKCGSCNDMVTENSINQIGKCGFIHVLFCHRCMNSITTREVHGSNTLVKLFSTSYVKRDSDKYVPELIQYYYNKHPIAATRFMLLCSNLKLDFENTFSIALPEIRLLDANSYKLELHPTDNLRIKDAVRSADFWVKPKKFAKVTTRPFPTAAVKAMKKADDGLVPQFMPHTANAVLLNLANKTTKWASILLFFIFMINIWTSIFGRIRFVFRFALRLNMWPTRAQMWVNTKQFFVNCFYGAYANVTSVHYCCPLFNPRSMWYWKRHIVVLLVTLILLTCLCVAYYYLPDNYDAIDYSKESKKNKNKKRKGPKSNKSSYDAYTSHVKDLLKNDLAYLDKNGTLYLDDGTTYNYVKYCRDIAPQEFSDDDNFITRDDDNHRRGESKVILNTRDNIKYIKKYFSTLPKNDDNDAKYSLAMKFAKKNFPASLWETNGLKFLFDNFPSRGTAFTKAVDALITTPTKVSENVVYEQKCITPTINPKLADRVFQCLVDGQFVSCAYGMPGGFILPSHCILDCQNSDYANNAWIRGNVTFVKNNEIYSMPKSQAKITVLKADPDLCHIAYPALGGFPKIAIADITEDQGYIIYRDSKGIQTPTSWMAAKDGMVATTISTDNGWCGAPYFTEKGLVAIHCYGAPDKNYGIALSKCKDELNDLATTSVFC